jgi:hypothetical protein
MIIIDASRKGDFIIERNDRCEAREAVADLNWQIAGSAY